MQLNIFARTAGKKGETKSLRREGGIPAVLYVRGKPSEPIMVKSDGFDYLMRHVKSGRLATTRIALVDENGRHRNAIIKDIQYHVTTYQVEHLDFEELIDKATITVSVPIECTGAVDCIGVKLGGVLRQVIRSLKVECLPKELPEYFELDVRNMAINDSRRLRDLAIPAAVRPLVDLNEVAVVIAKR